MNGLYVVNKQGELRTYIKGKEGTNIDVTLGGENIIKLVKKWEVREVEVSTDHRLIYCELDGREKGDGRQTGARLKRVHWKRYKQYLEEKLEEDKRTRCEGTEAAERIRNLQRSMVEAARRASVRNRNSRKGKQKWWNEELEKEKKEVYRRRRACQREREGVSKKKSEELYNQELKVYKRMVREAKQKSWGQMLNQEKRKMWGICYKIESGKVRPARILHALMTESGMVSEVEAVLREMVKGVVVKDSRETETEWQKEVRRRLDIEEQGLEEGELNPVDNEEVLAAICRFRKGKAPGLDGVTVEMVINGWEIIGDAVTEVLNECLSRGVFPEEWKDGEIVMLRKGDDRDPRLASSYRPICLLPVLGKIRERLILERMWGTIERSWDEWQFGCRKGKNVDDVLMEVGNKVNGSQSKYVLGVFYDIKEAFDHLWWPHLKSRLLELGLSKELYQVVESFLAGRTVILRAKTCSIREKVERGCPQGSVLGPYMWCVVFNEILGELRSRGMFGLAFMDDLCVIIEGGSRAELEAKGTTRCKIVYEWCAKRKLSE